MGCFIIYTKFIKNIKFLENFECTITQPRIPDLRQSKYFFVNSRCLVNSNQNGYISLVTTKIFQFPFIVINVLFNPKKIKISVIHLTVYVVCFRCCGVLLSNELKSTIIFLQIALERYAQLRHCYPRLFIRTHFCFLGSLDHRFNMTSDPRVTLYRVTQIDRSSQTIDNYTVSSHIF